MCVNTDCETPTNVTERLISVHRLINVIEMLLGWNSLIHLNTAAAISPGGITRPISFQPLRGAVSASHKDYMTKFGAAGYMPSAKYSYFAASCPTANKLNTLVTQCYSPCPVIICCQMLHYISYF